MSKAKTKSEVKSKVPKSKLEFSTHAENWSKVVKLLGLLDEANFIASDRGIELRSMDPSRVAMVDLVLPADSFESYHCVDTFRLGINLDEMTQVVNRMEKGEMLIMTFENTTSLTMTLIGADSTRAFTIELLDLGEADYPAPTIDHKAKIKLVTEQPQKAIKDAEVVSDHLLVHFTEKCLSLSAKSETKSYKKTIESDSDCVSSFEVKEESTASYSLSYLVEMFKNITSPLVSIAISASMPINVEAPIFGAGKIQFFLAPRIQV